MEILEKVAYMKGLAEGIGLDVKSKEGKLLKVMMDILDDIALELRDLRDEQDDLEAGLDAVSEDLADVEEYLYGLDGEDDGDDDGEDSDASEDDVYRTVCPKCGENIFFDEDILSEGVVCCPECGAELEFDLSDGDCKGCCGSCADPDEDANDEDDGGAE